MAKYTRTHTSKLIYIFDDKNLNQTKKYNTHTHTYTYTLTHIHIHTNSYRSINLHL